MSAPRRLCTRPGCERLHYALGLCCVHYARQARGADLDAPIVARGEPRDRFEFCSVDGCGRVPHSRGMCVAHYQRWRRGGPLTPALGTLTRHTGNPTARVECKFWLETWARQAVDEEALRSGRSIPEVLREAVESWARARASTQEAA